VNQVPFAGSHWLPLKLTNPTKGTETMKNDQNIETRDLDFPIGRTRFEAPDLTITQVIEQAPHSREFYDCYHEEDLDDIEDAWPGIAGGVYLFSCEAQPGWYIAIQSPDQGLVESQTGRWVPIPEWFRVIASWNGSDRFALLRRVWRKLAKISSERTNLTPKRAQWFRISDERIENDLPALIRSIS
jgi:hypothetical protein